MRPLRYSINARTIDAAKKDIGADLPVRVDRHQDIAAKEVGVLAGPARP
jgi:hypothetical protein